MTFWIFEVSLVITFSENGCLTLTRVAQQTSLTVTPWDFFPSSLTTYGNLWNAQGYLVHLYEMSRRHHKSSVFDARGMRPSSGSTITGKKKPVDNSFTSHVNVTLWSRGEKSVIPFFTHCLSCPVLRPFSETKDMSAEGGATLSHECDEDDDSKSCSLTPVSHHSQLAIWPPAPTLIFSIRPPRHHPHFTHRQAHTNLCQCLSKGERRQLHVAWG